MTYIASTSEPCLTRFKDKQWNTEMTFIATYADSSMIFR
jgi:hypothetical protein